MTGYKYSLQPCARYLLCFKELLAPVFIGLQADLMGKTGGFEALRAAFCHPGPRLTVYVFCRAQRGGRWCGTLVRSGDVQKQQLQVLFRYKFLFPQVFVSRWYALFLDMQPG
jgi:hypothetical protein